MKSRLRRREFLKLGGAGLAGVVLAASGCGGEAEREEGRVETVASEPKETDGLRESLEISTSRGTVSGVLHSVEEARGAAVMVGGARGGIDGPSDVYEELATRLQTAGAAALRLDYRLPNQLEECVHDLLAGVEALGQRGVRRVALVGHSFGGAVVISASAASDIVVGVATVASQTSGADAVGELAPAKSLLLIHGTGDTVLPYELAEDLYARAGEPKELVFYTDDNHSIDGNRQEMLEKLYSWSRELVVDN